MGSPHDPSNLLLLNRGLSSKDNTKYNHGKIRRIRNRWVKQQVSLSINTGLICQICGQSDLDPWSKNKQTLATLKHTHTFGINMKIFKSLVMPVITK